MRGRWALAAMGAAALLVGGLTNAADHAHLPGGWQSTVHGREGEDVTVGEFRLHVHGATASPQVGDPDETVTSSGSFVVVDLSYATTDEWAGPEEVVLVDATGHEYSDPSNLGLGGSPWKAGPDIWFRGQLLFEVPTEALGSLTLELRPETGRAILPSTVGRIPLTVATTTEPLELDGETVLAAGER